MSRTAEIVSSPVVKTLKWKNAKWETLKDEKGKVLKDEQGKPKQEKVRDTGWYYWDKNLNDGDGAEVMVDMPITFVWLETATSFSGYNKDMQQGVYSNEVLNTKEQPLIVKCGKETIAEGLYNDIKDSVKGQGGKYCQAVYALVEFEGEYEVWRFLMVGSSRDSWMNFSNKMKNKTHAITCYDISEKETPKGDIYELPVFKYLPLPEEMGKEADKVAVEQIDPYFKFILNKPLIEEETSTSNDY